MEPIILDIDKNKRIFNCTNNINLHEDISNIKNKIITVTSINGENSSSSTDLISYNNNNINNNVILMEYPVLRITGGYNGNRDTKEYGKIKQFSLCYGVNSIGRSSQSNINLTGYVSNSQCSKNHFIIEFDGKNFSITNKSLSRDIILKIKLKNDDDYNQQYTIKILKPNESYQIFNQTKIIVGSTLTLSLLYSLKI